MVVAPTSRGLGSDAGTLPYKAIIHVAGINLLWRASERSIRNSVQNAVKIAKEQGFYSIAFPIIGAGSGSFNEDQSLELMLDEFKKINFDGRVVVVRFKP